MESDARQLGAQQEEWLWGWDPTPGIVSVWADADGRAHVWRRAPDSGALAHETTRFRPWMLLERLDDLQHLGARLAIDGSPEAQVTYQELDGPGALRFLVSARRSRDLVSPLLAGASRRLGRRVGHVRDLGDGVLHLPPDEQYLVATGRTYFRGLGFDQVRTAAGLGDDGTRSTPGAHLPDCVALSVRCDRGSGGGGNR
ncbi:MAG: hypothetical protein U0163_04815 [Gemmatimonadaceae bacterium]